MTTKEHFSIRESIDSNYYTSKLAQTATEWKLLTRNDNSLDVRKEQKGLDLLWRKWRVWGKMDD